jgi:iron complex outermembrane receptor protein
MRTRKLLLPFALCGGVSAAAALSAPAQERDSALRVHHLDPVAVVGSAAAARQRLQPLELLHAGREYVLENRGGTLMNALEKLPGLGAFQVGQGISKPVIRGLGFSRLVVAENGIKQQGQQWGADHGLEIDQYGVEQVEVVKGPASLQYGSEAIAGVIAISSHAWRERDGLSGEVMLNGDSNNRLLGGTGDVRYQQRNRFVAARASYRSFESYRIPADSFTYLTYKYPIHNRVLKNTAGREADASLQAGLRTRACDASLLLSGVHSKAGFFAGASGLPHLINMDDNGKYRSVDLPYHDVTHLKAVLNQSFRLDDRNRLNLDLGYQRNLRQEYSPPHTHGFGPLPQGNLELEMRLQTLSLNAAWERRNLAGSALRAGVNAEYQRNRVGGYMFLLPEFEQLTLGVFAVNRFRFSDALAATVGARYDGGDMRIHRYEGVNGYFSVPELRKPGGSASFMAGMAYEPTPSWSLKVNAGKSFRLPSVSEYASNGVSHHLMRYELGDSALQPETSYQLDVHADFRRRWSESLVGSLTASASAFGSYFPGFIFLNPTGEYSLLPEAGQIYRYVQSRAARWGGELYAAADVGQVLTLTAAAEYVYAADLESGFPIAFTPPLTLTGEAIARWRRLLCFANNRAALTCRYAADQRRTARNELPTSGYLLFDASLGVEIPHVRIWLQVQNLLNTKYYKHLSFYRRLNLPEAGRNFLLSVQIPINS